MLWTTVWLSTVRAALALALAVVLAWIIARTDCPFRNQLEFLLILSFFFPLLGKVLGWALLLSPQKGYLNQLLRQLPFFAGDTGPLDVFSYGGLIFVSVTGWATLLTIFLVPAFRNMDAALEESARMCGASPRRTVDAHPGAAPAPGDPGRLHPVAHPAALVVRDGGVPRHELGHLRASRTRSTSAWCRSSRPTSARA